MKAKLIKSFVTVALLGLAIWAAVSLYHRYLQNPWTRDGQVRANVVGIAPRVSGPIIRVGVRDNQAVHQGDLLFEIDPADFQAHGLFDAHRKVLLEDSNTARARQW